MRIFLVRHGETPWNEEMRYQGQTDVPLSERGRKQAEALRELHFGNAAGSDPVQMEQWTGIKITKVYASDLQRAFETAEIIAGQGTGNREPGTGLADAPGDIAGSDLIHGGQGTGSRRQEIKSTIPFRTPNPEPRTPEIITCKDLREINYGVFEGVLLEDIKKNYAEILQQWWRDPQKARIPQGESLEELKERVLHCYHDIVDTHKETDDNILIVSHGGPLRIIFMDVLGFSLSQARSFRVDNTSLSIVEYKNSRPVLTLLNDTCHMGEG